MAEARRFFAPRAWIAGGWARDVLLVAGADGLWQRVQPDCGEADRAGCEVLRPEAAHRTQGGLPG